MRKHQKIAAFFLLSTLAVPCFAQQESLLIGPGDLIQVDVMETPEMEQQVRVTDDGSVSLAYIGSTHIAGQTPATAAARAMPGVLGVWTGTDLTAANYGPFTCGLPLKNRDGTPLLQTNRIALMTDKVRYVGDPVAFVVAETLAQARDAGEAVVVEIDPLPAVLVARITGSTRTDAGASASGLLPWVAIRSLPPRTGSLSHSTAIPRTLTTGRIMSRPTTILTHTLYWKAWGWPLTTARRMSVLIISILIASTTGARSSRALKGQPMGRMA